jgi:small-conductance mechanosensitive channel
VFQRRPFAHSSRSAFGLVARRRGAAAAPPPPAGEQQLLLLLGLRRRLELQLEAQRAEMAAQHLQAQQAAAAAAQHHQLAQQQQQQMDRALQALLGGESRYPQDPEVRVRLAEKLVAARGVLQARMARRSYSQHALHSGRYSPYSSPAQSPVAAAAAAATPSGRDGGEAAAARELDALRSARSLLAQYSL